MAKKAMAKLQRMQSDPELDDDDAEWIRESMSYIGLGKPWKQVFFDTLRPKKPTILPVTHQTNLRSEISE